MGVRGPRRRPAQAPRTRHGTPARTAGGDGSWRVMPGGQLVLQFNNGNVGTYSLVPGKAGNEVLLNGKRYFVMNR